MTIIPYTSRGCLQSNSLYHFTALKDAAYWAFKEMIPRPDNIDTIVFRFRIIDSEEDFTISFSKKDGNIIAQNGWLDLCGFKMG